MFGRTRKRKDTLIDSMIGPNTEVNGDLRFSGALLVQGKIKGNVTALDDGHSAIQLTEAGTIEGEVRGPYVVLDGVVIGDVFGSEHVELSSKARVTGNVYYNLMEMAIGAEVNGKLVHSPNMQESAAPLASGQANPLEAD
jgi:cytoskeletal protein CcmA (bactofilin family)